MSRSTSIGKRVATIAAAGLAGIGGWFGYQLLVQNGRLLLRIEELERRLDALTAPAPGTDNDIQRGFPAGSVVHDFALPTLSGGTMTLSQWSGRRVLLIFFDPWCSYCRQLLPDLARLEPDPSDGRPVPLLISTGTVEAHRPLIDTHGVRCVVLLQERDEVAQLYGVDGTPMAYLIDEQGTTVGPLAVGRQEILVLADATPSNDTGSVEPALPENGHTPGRFRSAEPRPTALNGLPSGTMAPGFRLPHVDGGELSLDNFRGRRTLLVFSDPHCEPCDRLLPKLEQLHRSVPTLQVVIVSRGDPAASRAQVTKHRLTFPVALQRRWEVSREYGILATPVGYLLDDTGVVAASVAVGGDAVLELAAGAAL